MDAEITKLKKQVNNLTIQKAACLGIIDNLIERLPLVHRNDVRESIGRMKILTPMYWDEDLPYEIDKPTQNTLFL